MRDLFKAALGLVLFGAIVCVSLSAQTPNDHCFNAIPVFDGVPQSGNNNTATTGPEPIASCPTQLNDVWYVYTASCTGIVTASLCANLGGGGNFDTVMAAWSGGCGCLTELACNDDTCSLRSQVSFPSFSGSTYYISIGGYEGEIGNFTLMVNCAGGNAPILPLSFGFTSSGSGTLGYAVSGGPPNGLLFVGVTQFAGSFPNGPFFGIELNNAELQNLLATGFPFFTNLDSCGALSAGPFGGLPIGLTIYGVALSAPTFVLPTHISAPTTATVF